MSQAKEGVIGQAMRLLHGKSLFSLRPPQWVLLIGLVFETLPVASRQPADSLDLYEHPHTFQMGLVTIEKARLMNVQKTSYSDQFGRSDLITHAVLAEGAHFVLRDRHSDILVDGTVTDGDRAPTPSTIRASIVWNAEQARSCQLLGMSIHLKNARLAIHAIGGGILVPPAVVIHLKSSGRVFSPSLPQGNIEIEIPRADLQHPDLRWASLKLHNQFRISNLLASLSLDNGNISFKSGMLSASSAEAESSRFPTRPFGRVSVTDFFPEHEFDSQLVKINGLTIMLKDEHATIQARSAILDYPNLTYSIRKDLRVRGVEKAVLHNLTAQQTQFSAAGASFSQPTAKFTLVPDNTAIVEALNEYGDVDNADCLLPSGYSYVPYVTRVTLYNFLAFSSSAAQSDLGIRPSAPAAASGTNSPAVPSPLVIEIKDGIAAAVPSPTPDMLRDFDKALPPEDEKRMFELVESFVPFPEVAPEIFEELPAKWLESVFGSPAHEAAGIAAWLNASTRVSPLLGPGAFKTTRSLVAAVPKVTKEVGQRVLERLADSAAEYMSQLKDQYLKNALPATLRYDRRATSSDYSSWKSAQNGRYGSELSQQQARSSEAASRNEQNNARTRREAHLRADAMRQAQREAETQRIMPGPPGGDGGQAVTGPPGTSSDTTTGRNPGNIGYGNARSGKKYGCIETGESGGIQAICTTSGH